MNTFANSPIYLGDVYRHGKTGFFGVVVKEVVPGAWAPDRVLLTLEDEQDQREFPLSELDLVAD